MQSKRCWSCKESTPVLEQRGNCRLVLPWLELVHKVLPEVLSEASSDLHWSHLWRPGPVRQTKQPFWTVSANGIFARCGTDKHYNIFKLIFAAISQKKNKLVSIKLTLLLKKNQITCSLLVWEQTLRQKDINDHDYLDPWPHVKVCISGLICCIRNVDFSLVYRWSFKSTRNWNFRSKSNPNTIHQNKASFYRSNRACSQLQKECIVIKLNNKS